MNSTCLTRFSHSSKRNGRLSRALGRRKPCSTSVSLRLWSPANMPRTCGSVTCDSSTIMRKSSGKKSMQRVGRLAGLAAAEPAGVVLDAGAVADLQQHLHVEARAGRQPLRLQQLALLAEHLQPLFQLLADALDGLLDALLRRDEVLGRDRCTARRACRSVSPVVGLMIASASTSSPNSSMRRRELLATPARPRPRRRAPGTCRA